MWSMPVFPFGIQRFLRSAAITTRVARCTFPTPRLSKDSIATLHPQVERALHALVLLYLLRLLERPMRGRHLHLCAGNHHS